MMAGNDKAQPMQIPVPDPALKRLESLVGIWELRGRTLDSKVDDLSGWTTFEWMPGGFFLKVSGEIEFRGFKVQSLEMVAYDPKSQTFPSSVYTNMSGAVLAYQWEVQGNLVTHWMETAKYTGTISEDGNTLSGGWRPIEGKEGAENVAYDAVMTRVK
ncbi:MAG: hypothetical protein A2Y61_03045 [Chloroflexi bacterium RBG_13_60_13]|nr:MAG: hypothetical protein A2Y61_03045 [Chloroflexi bacterium RBG_13_60_13]